MRHWMDLGAGSFEGHSPGVSIALDPRIRRDSAEGDVYRPETEAIPPVAHGRASAWSSAPERIGPTLGAWCPTTGLAPGKPAGTRRVRDRW